MKSMMSTYVQIKNAEVHYLHLSQKYMFSLDITAKRIQSLNDFANILII